jgi:hypothetical protein
MAAVVGVPTKVLVRAAAVINLLAVVVMLSELAVPVSSVDAMSDSLVNELPVCAAVTTAMEFAEFGC